MTQISIKWGINFELTNCLILNFEPEEYNYTCSSIETGRHKNIVPL